MTSETHGRSQREPSSFDSNGAGKAGHSSQYSSAEPRGRDDTLNRKRASSNAKQRTPSFSENIAYTSERMELPDADLVSPELIYRCYY
jgi:hypothetical protein